MKRCSPSWSALVDRWNEIEASMADEVGIDWSKGRSAPKTYQLMQGVLLSARQHEPKASGGTDVA